MRGGGMTTTEQAILSVSEGVNEGEGWCERMC